LIASNPCISLPKTMTHIHTITPKLTYEPMIKGFRSFIPNIVPHKVLTTKANCPH